MSSLPPLSSVPWFAIGLTILGSTALYYATIAIPFLLQPYLSPIRALPGPDKPPSWLFGHLGLIFKADNSVLHEQWAQEYGPTFKYKGLMGSDRLFTMDTRGIGHILQSPHWQKPPQLQKALERLLGAGLLVTEGAAHSRQRRVLNPAFGPGQIRELTPIFLEKAIQLRDFWLVKANESNGAFETDALSWLSRATLDIIGIAGFNYQFKALNESGSSNELSDAFAKVLHSGPRFRWSEVFRNWFPILRIIPTERERQELVARRTMDRIGMELIREKRKTILASSKGLRSKDILTLMIQANMATDLPPQQRLSDEEVMAHVPTFLLAGHETTSSSTAWCLYALSLHLTIQAKLRSELLGVGTDLPSMETLNSLPYLDAVVRETLRVYSVVPSTIRIAQKDDIIPLSTPFVDRNGVTQNTIKVRKGDNVFVPILALNRSNYIWGDDCREFNPDRWSKVTERSNSIPGIFAGLLTFLGGPHSCIGYRFALIEMKALVFHIVRGFHIELAVAADQIRSKTAVVSRPMVVGEDTSRLPVRLTPIRDM